MYQKNSKMPGVITGNRKTLARRIWQYRYAYLMLIPVAAYFIIFHFLPMGGIVIAFKEYRVNKGIWGSDWVGMENFAAFFRIRSFGSIIRNSIAINIVSILLSFPMGIIFAILLNGGNTCQVQEDNTDHYLSAPFCICGGAVQFVEYHFC